MPEMQPIADRLEFLFLELADGPPPTAIELSAADAQAFQEWLDECARQKPGVVGEGWRFGGIPIVRMDAPRSRVICQIEFAI